MKGILIDVKNRTITEHEIGKGLEPIYEKIGCELFDIVNIDDSNDVYVDDEGLYKENDFFSIEGGHQPFRGNGLVLGIDNNSGKSVSTTLTVEKVTEMIKFHTLNEVKQMID